VSAAGSTAKERATRRRHRHGARLALLLALPLALAALAVSAANPHPRVRVRPHGHTSPAGWRSPGGAYPATASDRSEQSFRLPAGGGKVVVDDVAGNVTARVVDGDVVRIVARQLVHATSSDNLEVARREMPLELSQHGDTVIAFVHSPFRDEEGRLQGPWEDLPYRVLYDVEVEVPRRAAVDLSTVLDGDVELASTDGGFEVRNVNGDVRVREVSGAGSARTVNGELQVTFRRNPAGPCEFHNVNGDVDVSFRTGLAADVRFRTMNGEGWSDFPYTLLPVQVAASEHRRNGRFVIKSDWSQGIRIGAGGPQLSFSTINGDVLIRNGDA
jgi:hypothetical protein